MRRLLCSRMLGLRLRLDHARKGLLHVTLVVEATI
jgi:hypothetical protein